MADHKNELPTWPCPLCNATGETKLRGECAGCDGDGEIVRGFWEC